jgi:hypothetical protein
MHHTPASSFNQVHSGARLNKRSSLDGLPVIDPALISIKCLASRYPEEMEDTFNQITNASSNDGYEVSVIRYYGGIPSNPECSKEERIDLHSAFNILTMHTRDNLHELIREWWYKHYREWPYLDFRDIHKIELKAPPEIRYALQVIRLHGDKVTPFKDICDAIEYYGAPRPRTLAAAH